MKARAIEPAAGGSVPSTTEWKTCPLSCPVDDAVDERAPRYLPGTFAAGLAGRLKQSHEVDQKILRRLDSPAHGEL